MIQDRINNNLQALYNVHDDPVYKALICDENGVNPTLVSLPTDIDIGMIASQIEYLRRLSIDLMKQIFIDQSSQEFLIYQLEDFFSSLRLGSESDAEWVARTISIVMQPKVSNAAIIFALRPYSSIEPVIENVETFSAFADFSFADVYAREDVIFGTETIYVFPAIAEDYDSSFFTIKITLWDTTSIEIILVQNLIKSIVAAGITVILQINYS